MSLSKSQTNIAAMLAKAGHKVSVIDASDPRKAPIVQEFNHKPIMSADDEIAALRAENNMLKGVLVQRPEMREIVGELRRIRELMIAKEQMSAIVRATALLRRLDESQ